MSHVRKSSFSRFSTFALLLAVLAVVPMEAWAFFEPPAGDKSIKLLLEPIFGDLFSGGEGGGPLSKLIEVFNGAVLLVGGTLAAYTLLAGTMATAHDGEMLGKKWSSMWLPIRTAVGTGLCIPLGTGFCAAQLLMGWLTAQGIGLGSDLWIAFTDTYVSASNMKPAGTAPRVESLAQSLLKTWVCVEGFNAAKAKGSGTENFILSSDYGEVASGSSTYNYGAVSGGAAKDACGKATAPDPDELKKNADTATTDLKELGLSVNLNVDKLINDSIAAHKSAYKTLSDSMKTLAKQIVDAEDNNTDLPAPGAFKTATDAYQKSIETAFANPAMDSAFTQIKAAAQADGWVLAGAWFLRLASLQDATNNAMYQGQYKLINDGSNQVMEDPRIAQYRVAYSKFTTQASSTYTGMDPDYAAGAGSAGSGSGEEGKSWWKKAWDSINPVEWIKKKYEELTRGVIVGAIKHVTEKADTHHPIVFAKSLGHEVLGMMNAIAIAGAVVSLFPNVNAFVGPLFTLFTAAFGSTGAMLSFYIPFLPFMLFTAAVLGWLFYVVEAVLAAPLWAVMHLHPDGHEWSGRGGPGYMLIISLLLQPALIIIGYCTAIVVLEPVVHFINTIFFPMLISSVGYGIGGIIMAFFGLTTYLMFLIEVLQKTFGLIHYVPDHVLRWIGGGGNNLGSSAREMAQSSQGAATAIGGAAAGAALSKSLGERVQKAQGDKARQDERALGRDSNAQGALQAAASAEKAYENAQKKADDNPSDNSLKMAAAEAAVKKDETRQAAVEASRAAQRGAEGRESFNPLNLGGGKNGQSSSHHQSIADQLENGSKAQGLNSASSSSNDNLPDRRAK